MFAECVCWKESADKRSEFKWKPIKLSHASFTYVIYEHKNMRAIVMIMGIHDELHSIVAIFVYRFYANYNDISMEIDVQSKSYFFD